MAVSSESPEGSRGAAVETAAGCIVTFLYFPKIMREIQEHKIKIYEFPEVHDEESKLVKKIKVQR